MIPPPTKFTHPVDPRLQDQAHLCLEQFAEREGLPAKVTFAVDTALTESLQNVIDHSGAQMVSVFLVRAGNEVVVELFDDGAAFDPSTVPDPDVSLPLDVRPIGGLGLLMVRRLMDRVEYRREGSRNRLTFVKRMA